MLALLDDHVARPLLLDPARGARAGCARRTARAPRVSLTSSRSTRVEQLAAARRACRRSSSSWCRTRPAAALRTWSSTSSCSTGSMLPRNTHSASRNASGISRLEVGEHAEPRLQRLAASSGRSCRRRTSGSSRPRPARAPRGRRRGRRGSRAPSTGKSSPDHADQLHRAEAATRPRRRRWRIRPARPSARPNGVSTVSSATLPTTSSDI